MRINCSLYCILFIRIIEKCEYMKEIVGYVVTHVCAYVIAGTAASLE